MKSEDDIACVKGCGACCVAPSISSAIPAANGHPGMPDGKPAGVPCLQLRADRSCGIWGRAERPDVCVSLKPNREMCGQGPAAAFDYLAELERLTDPDPIT
ncbi:MAG: YkgJ family cysteine cluster protein [Spirochaetes bacterium]|nr:YkgJ family cysteine cluster protein [Spirochaetota bacterium]